MTIHEVRGQRVVVDEELAALYAVPTRTLNQAVRRNRSRFPEDFLFQLTAEEIANLKSQTVISSWGGRRRSLPWAFSEHGVAMLSTVLRSPRAIAVSVEVVRAFVRLRRLHGEHRELARKMDQLEKAPHRLPSD
ncbi:MAG: ORF6N domain-containing protein [Chloroflexota bacterium]